MRCDSVGHHTGSFRSRDSIKVNREKNVKGSWSGRKDREDSQDSCLAGICGEVNGAGTNVQRFALLAFKVFPF